MSYIARPYAKAAFEFAKAHGIQSKWAAMLHYMAELMKNSQMQQAAKNPKISPEKLIALCLDLAKSVLDDHAKNFIRLLASRHRLLELPTIATLYANLLAASEKKITATVTSAVALSEKHQQQLSKRLSKRFQSEVALECKVDSKILGGLIIRVGDKVIDYSLSGRLNRLHTALMA